MDIFLAILIEVKEEREGVKPGINFPISFNDIPQHIHEDDPWIG